MSIRVAPQADLASAWLATALAVQQHGGRAAHVLTTLTAPTTEEHPGIRAVIDDALQDMHRGGQHIQTVATVANTIFPAALYRAALPAWQPGGADLTRALDEARDELFRRYARNLPLLRRFDGNRSGTYFQRMTAWPTPDGFVNQLDERIVALRRAREQHHRFANVNDIALAGPDLDVTPLSIHKPTDRRLRGFPCLVHIDLSVVSGQLLMLAVYRHQYLLTKAYGNMVGLHRLHLFLAQQTGYPPGELCVQATFADLETTGAAWGARRARNVLQRAQHASAQLAVTA